MTELEELSLFYRGLAECYLSERFSLPALEKGFMECDPPFTPTRPDAALKFLSLVNYAHIERLDEQGMDMLKKLYAESTTEPINLAADSPATKEIPDFLEKTLSNVLTADFRQGVDFEYFPDIYGRGIHPGNALVFIFCDQTDFEAPGRLNTTAEQKKARIFQNVKRQFEEMVLKKSGATVKLVRI